MYGRADGMPSAPQSVVVCDSNSTVLAYKGVETRFCGGLKQPYYEFGFTNKVKNHSSAPIQPSPRHFFAHVGVSFDFVSGSSTIELYILY